MDRKEIERIRREGEISAIKNQIGVYIFRLKETTWNNIVERSNYCRLGEAIGIAEGIIKDIKTLFHTLQEIEPENK